MTKLPGVPPHSLLVRFAISGLTAISLTGLAAVATPSAVLAESLRGALNSTYKYNPRLDAERARLRATDEEVSRANSGYRPTISGSADINYQHNDTRPPSVNDGDNYPKGYGVNMTQPIFRGFRTMNAVREAEALVRVGRETLRTVEQSVLLEAVTAYMDVVRDQAIVKLRENNVQVLSRELKATQDRFSVGEVTRTDVAQAQARRAASVSALDLAQANLKTSRASFERVVGHPPSRLREQRLPEKLLPRSLQSALGIGQKEHPAVVAALYREQAARHTVDKTWGELLPTVQLEANYSHRYDPSRVTNEQEVTTVTGRVNVPLYQGGEVRARVRQAKHTHVSRLQEIEQNRTEVQASITSAWSQLVAARAQLQSDQVQVRATQTALAGVREEERVGQRTLLDVLNAEQEALNAKVQIVTTERNLVVAGYNLLATVGRLNVAEIGVSEKVYDPEVHYQEVRRKWWGIDITRRDGRREHHELWESHGKNQPMK
ncbi:MAG: TolC family outer membrane protein [Hyphomicrobiaceae bacterium]